MAALVPLMAWHETGARADLLAAYPPEVTLDHGSDVQQMVVVGSRADGVTQDLTRQSTFTFEPEGIAQLDETLRLKPIADGDTVLTIHVEGQSLTVPVHVKRSTEHPSVSFRNDVQAVLMRTGCNSGGCHGSAQGKNGFRLSLFGFDPGVDYMNLTRDVRGRRLNTANPDESLMLLKPTGGVDHEGGTRFTQDSEFHDTLRRWIAAGAPDDPPDLPTLTGIAILPEESVLEGEGSSQQLTVMAKYSDGTDRDVTNVTILSSSDEQTVKVNETGLITAGGRGEGYIMARYGTFAVVSQVIVLPEGMTLNWPETPVNNYIDELIYARLKKLRVPPAALSTDETFVRRVYLDVLGVLPTVEEVKSFVGDSAPDKRERLVDALLQRPEFPDVWAMKYAEVLRVSPSITGEVKGMHRYNDWLRHSITSNKPLDQMVRELLTAQGGNFTEPAANFYVTEDTPIVMAENVAQVFLGLQIKCAQCHNHPFERWTMDDYYSFAAFFAQVGRKPSSDPRETIVYDRQSGEVTNIKNNQVMAPKFLGGAMPDVSGKDRRAVLAEWLTSPDNPWFAKNAANRVWQQFFGKGIVDPIDDFRVSNPPSNPQLLEALAGKLVEYQYDLRKLVRDICTSYTYQMATQPRDSSIVDDRNFSHALVRRLSAEQLLDAISQVTESKVKFPSLPLGARAVQVASGKSGNYFLELFGRPARETVSACERTSDPTLAQALHLINGDTVERAISAPGGRLERQLAAGMSTSEMVEDLYLAAFARGPKAEEKTALEAYLAKGEDKRLALQDVYWSILNSKEFVFNH